MGNLTSKAHDIMRELKVIMVNIKIMLKMYQEITDQINTIKNHDEINKEPKVNFSQIENEHITLQ